jgi:ubiquinone/menaquinone biosynthesis C-methylase UbiE
MKLNWAERAVVNNPSRIWQQRIEGRWFAKAMPLQPGSKILEVGCGRGAGARIISGQFQPKHLHAMDLDIRMIRMAHQYLDVLEKKVITLSVGDLIRLPFKNSSQDAVFGFGVLHHVPNWQEALSEISRVLKPTGIYYIEELYPSLYQNFITRRILLHPDRNRFESRDLKKALAGENLILGRFLEHRWIGILGTAVKILP